MCEFPSWVEAGGNVYFLTRAQVDSPQGDILQRRFPGEGELIGHAAIRAYYDLDTGVNKECTDFSKPDNFPLVIAKAIKNGEFRLFGTPKGLLLCDAVGAKWQAEWNAVGAKWQAERNAVDAKWQAERDAVGANFWDLFAIPENRNSAWK